MDQQLSYAAARTKGVNAARREIEAIVSDETIDRVGDIIDCASWQLDRYRSNPVVLFAHRHTEPIGRTEKIWIEGTQLHARMVLADTDRGREVMQLFSEGALRAFSVGFRVGRILDEVHGGRNVLRLLDCELMEISAVAVPANSNALIKAKSLGLVPPAFEMSDTDAIINGLVRSALRSDEMTGEQLEAIEHADQARKMLDDALGTDRGSHVRTRSTSDDVDNIINDLADRARAVQ